MSVHLRGHIAQVKGVVHGLLSPLVIGCSSQVTSVEATPPVVSVGGPVEHVHAGRGEVRGQLLSVTVSYWQVIRLTCRPP